MKWVIKHSYSTSPIDGRAQEDGHFARHCICHPRFSKVVLRSKDGKVSSRVLWVRHHFLYSPSERPEASGGSLEMDNEGCYQIQDAAGLIKDIPYRGKFLAETAKLLNEQIEGMYDIDDIRHCSGG